MENNNCEENAPKNPKKESEPTKENNIYKETLGTGDSSITSNKHSLHKKDSVTNTFLVICLVGVSLGVIIPEAIKAYNRYNSRSKDLYRERKTYWVYSNDNDTPEDQNGHLRHVHRVLDRVGYRMASNDTPWTLLWSHKYPFKTLDLHNLGPDQLVNHFPATGYISVKATLATTPSKYIPKAFKFPKDKQSFINYAENNPNAMFIEKNNDHRGVVLKNVSDIDLGSETKFVQEYMQNPFLVDGHKFDIGVYVVVTSVDPLRVYWYKGDAIFRYCPAKYYPFDPKILDKYVVADDYLPTWEVPSMTLLYSALGNSMKESFDSYVRSQGKDPAPMWEDIQRAIAEVFIMKEHHIIGVLKKYLSKKNFFELFRFDFIVDEDLTVYLLEANMSPNLNSAHFSQNQLLYEQVIYNTFSLTGITRRANVEGANLRDNTPSNTMISAMKNIAVFSDECSTTCKDDCEVVDLCRLCKPCLEVSLKQDLISAYTEHLERADFRRLMPPPTVPHKDINLLESELKNLTIQNKLLHLWYQGKCNQDPTFCA